MKRIMLIVAGVATIVVGSHALAASPPATVVSGADTCTAGSGAVCTTEGNIPCCADGDACYSQPDLCLAMFCESYPNSQRCAGGTDTTGVR